MGFAPTNAAVGLRAAATSSLGRQGPASRFGLAPGASSVGRYELLRELGSGGMATVWLARATGAGGFERFVALKRLHPRFASDARLLGMLLNEARLSACIHHANVVSVEDVFIDEGQAVLVTPYVPGHCLAGVLDSIEVQAIPSRVAVALALDLLSGLHAAHEARSLDGAPLAIVHRYVSPQNVIVGSDGITRLLDFGIATSLCDSTAERATACGKPPYMSPEQLRGDALDRRADVFGAAAVVWRMLTGAVPFAGTTTAERIASIARGPLDRRGEHARQDVHDVVLSVLSRALASERQRRPLSALALAVELSGAAEAASRDELVAWLGLIPRTVEPIFIHRKSDRVDADANTIVSTLVRTIEPAAFERHRSACRGSAVETTAHALRRPPRLRLKTQRPGAALSFQEPPGGGSP